MSVAQLLVQLVGDSVLGDGGEWICSEVLVDVEQGDGLHQRAEDDLLVVGEVELKKEIKKLEQTFSREQSTITHLNGAVCQMHDDCTLRAEPSVQMRNARDAVALRDGGIGTGLDQMLRHVTLEVGQQLHFLFEFRRIRVDCDVSLLSLLVDEVDVAGKKIV